MTDSADDSARSNELSVFTDELADRVYGLVASCCTNSAVKAVVEANHDDNRWWPLQVADWRIRMLVAGWSTRVSYAMVDTYAAVVKAADAAGWETLTAMPLADVAELVRPIGLTDARVRYLCSLAGFVSQETEAGTPLLTLSAGTFIERFAARVDGASFKVAQCAALYSRGYHCGIIPVDSGMVTKLAPLLGMRLENGPRAHERMRFLLESCALVDADAYRELIDTHTYQVSLPDQVPPTWWLHLVLIYFKRLFLRSPHSPRLCTLRPACPVLLDCQHAPAHIRHQHPGR